MPRGRKKEDRSKLAGERLHTAKTLFDKSYQDLTEDDQWTRRVRVFDARTIRRWVHEGLPENRIGSVATYFGVSGHAFTDPELDTSDFKKLIYAQIYRHEHGDRTDGIDPDRFDWDRLAADMHALADQSIDADRGYTLKNIFLFQDAQFKPSGRPAWEAVGSLKDALTEFDFAEAKRNGKPVVLYGDFGIGKTSFLKMFASHLVASSHAYFPIFIPLRELPVQDTFDLAKLIARCLDNYGRISLNRLNRKILLLLDGFDELNLLRNDADWIQKVLQQLTALYRYPNLHLIISTRPILFHKEEDNLPQASPIFQILEFEEERIEGWILKWKTIAENADSQISLEGLRARNLLTITRNPLLLYMTANIFDSELTDPITYSRGIIYQRFYDWTIRGKFKADQQAHDLPDNYRQLLQNIAMTMRALGSNDEFIAFETLKKRITQFQEEVPEESVFKVNEMVLVAHLFKIRDTDEIKYIEFAHKSFREYMVAEKLFDFFRESIAAGGIDMAKWLAIGRMLPKKEEFDFLKDLLYTLPDADLVWLHGEIATGKFQYLLVSSGYLKKVLRSVQFPEASEIGTIYFRSINLSCLAYIVGNIIYSKLADRWEALVEDHPGHNDQTPSKIYVTTYIFHVCHSTPGVALDDSLYNQNWLIAKAFMHGIVLSELTLNGIDFSHAQLDRASLARASLTRCSFASANLVVTDYSGAVCQGTDSSNSFCANTDFSRARLRQVTFRDAEIYHADFTGAQLTNVDFSGTRIENCRFDDCSFRNVIYDADKISDCRGFGLESTESAPAG